MRTFILAVALAALPAVAHAQSFQQFASGFKRPLDFVADPTDDNRFYVVEQGGTIRVIENGSTRLTPFFNIADHDFTDQQNEQGLLGMAFDPHYADNGYFYVNYTARKGTTHVSRFHATSPTTTEPGSETVLLKIEQPYWNHNGGCIMFGPDNMLYISTGDGGAGDDPKGNGQNKNTLLGKMLRIDVGAKPADGLAYGIPSDNPFVDTDGARPEIWAYGLRNPWRFSFDSKGRMWIGDVGQNRYEEIDLQPEGSKGGENYGWNKMEGFGPFVSGNKKSDDPKPLSAKEHAERGFVAPIWAYRQNPDGSVTGGYFYEGDAVPSLKNRYIFAEYQRGNIWSFRLRDGKVDDLAEHTDAFRTALAGQGPEMRVSSFGRDNHGELYLCDLKGGMIYKVVE